MIYPKRGVDVAAIVLCLALIGATGMALFTTWQHSVRSNAAMAQIKAVR